MKRKLLVLIALAACLMVTGCDRGGRDAFGEEGKDSPVDESMSQEPYIEGFENASIEYEKFNSPAEENGLGDTHIYVEGTVLSQEVMDNNEEESSTIAPQYRIITIKQKDGNKWIIGMPSETKIEEIKNKYVRAFGMYQGFSDVKDLPALFIVSTDEDFVGKARIDVEDEGEFRTVYSYYEWMLKKMDEESENSDSASDEGEPKEPEGDSDNKNELPFEYKPSGQYKIGTDMDAGEYVLLAEDGDGFFNVNSDANGNDIIFNGGFGVNTIITVNDGEFVELRRCIAVKYDDFYPENSIKTEQEGIMVKIGNEIAEGEYRVEGEDGFYSIYNDSRQTDIIANGSIDGSGYINVSTGQYLELRRCRIAEKTS